MSAFSVNNIKKHFDYPEKQLTFAVQNKNILIMKTFVVVKAGSERYHIYNAVGNCVAVVASREDALRYFDAELTTSPCTSIVFRYTAASGTYIVTLK